MHPKYGMNTGIIPSTNIVLCKEIVLILADQQRKLSVKNYTVHTEKKLLSFSLSTPEETFPLSLALQHKVSIMKKQDTVFCHVYTKHFCPTMRPQSRMFAL